jgi:hypothetical protein
MRQIPNKLLPTVLSWMEPFKEAIEAGGEFEGVATEINKLIRKEPRPYVEILGITWIACVTDPVTVPDEEYIGAPGTIPLRWVHLEDLEYVFDWAQGVTESAVDFFRRRQAEGLPMVGEGAEGGSFTRDVLEYLRPANEGPVGSVPVERGDRHLGSSGVEPPQDDADGGVYPDPDPDASGTGT